MNQQMRIHAHNGLLGHVSMARSGMRAIIDRDSTSNRAKELAQEVFGLLCELDRDIRANRVDPPKPAKQLKPGDPGFEWPACDICGSTSLRCGCD